jgi:hypothetical protein
VNDDIALSAEPSEARAQPRRRTPLALRLCFSSTRSKRFLREVLLSFGFCALNFERSTAEAFLRPTFEISHGPAGAVGCSDWLGCFSIFDELAILNSPIEHSMLQAAELFEKMTEAVHIRDFGFNRKLAHFFG